MNANGTLTARGPVSAVAVTNAFLRSVYNWMGLGLGITALLAALFAYTDLRALPLSPGGQSFGFMAMIAEVALVFYLSLRIQKLSAGAATGIFLLYSALNGFTLSLILMLYSSTAVAQAFITTAGMFGAMSLYGLYTQKDLAGWGSLLFMGLIGLLIAMVVNIFLGSSLLGLGISVVGVIIFLGLTAYDTQLLKEMGRSVPYDDPAAVRRGAILGALRLYLDFINLFLMILRFVGDRR
ncbi:MAG: Bax inhibitor-1/YccA family protein [Deltaproteobacteria bacterium]|jgi:FtsH-binding integral membrane protein|nr:Bax inhibitor-1/YccA family protein [Deltaproteobacteria bacterium]